MLFNDYYAQDYHHQHHRELVAEAHKALLAKLALSGREQADPFYYEALAALGRQLSDWGDQLQERYSCPDLVPANESGQ